MIPGIAELTSLKNRAAKRDYPRDCEYRGERVDWADDDDLPRGMKLKVWQCHKLDRHVTWRDCGALSKQCLCNVRTDQSSLEIPKRG